jgi:16S rRNA (cytosine1402-N4)-methyltransferase
MKTELEHEPVLMEEMLAGLNVRPDGVYIDATFGRGGHTRGVLQRLGPKGRLLAMDCDPEAVHMARLHLSADARFEIKHGNFSTLRALVRQAGLAGAVDGLLLDLGVSSPQLDDPERGFGFAQDGPLDMRMDPHTGESAASWLNRADLEEIAYVCWRFGEERFSRRIARAIVNARARTAVETTAQLAEIVVKAVPKRDKHKHPATRTFQGIRIFINRELDALEAALEQSLEVLGPGGRLVVLSFHSLEDRIVKRFIRDHWCAAAHARSVHPKAPRGLPPSDDSWRPTLKPIGKKLAPSAAEVRRNPRARSALLRIAERLA